MLSQDLNPVYIFYHSLLFLPRSTGCVFFSRCRKGEKVFHARYAVHVHQRIKNQVHQPNIHSEIRRTRLLKSIFQCSIHIDIREVLAWSEFIGRDNCCTCRSSFWWMQWLRNTWLGTPAWYASNFELSIFRLPVSLWYATQYHNLWMWRLFKRRVLRWTRADTLRLYCGELYFFRTIFHN